MNKENRMLGKYGNLVGQYSAYLKLCSHRENENDIKT
jgi:hypothetical protein